jgi:thymidylate synthase (FAD)
MWVAARTCYSEKSPIEMWEERYLGILREAENYNEKTWKVREEKQEKMWNLVSKVLESGHASIAENISFTFAIEGINRACLAQLTRHRAGIVFSVMSQRYVEIKESYETLVEAFDGNTVEQEKYLKIIAEKYFTEVNLDNYRPYIQALINYLGAVKRGIKPEDARNILPNATKTNLVMTVNLRELMHVCSLRLCNRAQLPIRQLFRAIKDEVNAVEPKLAALLVPSCEANHGICFEGKSCGRYPTINEVKGEKYGDN